MNSYILFFVDVSVFFFFQRNTKLIVSGSFGRWIVGLVVITQIIAFNQTGAITVLFSTVVALGCAIFSGIYTDHFLFSTALPYIPIYLHYRRKLITDFQFMSYAADLGPSRKPKKWRILIDAKNS